MAGGKPLSKRKFDGASEARQNSPVENVKKALNRIRAATKIDFISRDLRRTVASQMTALGIPRLTVSKILNHKEKGVTAVYDRHSYEQEKKSALEVWDSRITQILSGKANAMQA